MLRPLALFAAGAALLAGPASVSAQMLHVGPLVRTLTTEDGAGTLQVTVRNDAPGTAWISVVAQDWSVGEDGVHTFHATGTQPESCGGELSVSDATLRLEPGDSARVEVRYRGSARTCRNIVFFRMEDRPEELAGDRLIISTGVKVYVEPRPPGGG